MKSLGWFLGATVLGLGAGCGDDLPPASDGASSSTGGSDTGTVGDGTTTEAADGSTGSEGGESTGTTGDPTASVEVLWDTWGIPHVYAQSDAELAYGQAWAHMHGHGQRVLELYARSRGQAAMLHGEQAVSDDTYVLMMGVPERAAQDYAAATDEERAIVDAYAAGINAWAEAHPDEIDELYAEQLPITGQDVVGHVAYAIGYRFLLGPTQVDAIVADFLGLEAPAPTGPRLQPASNAWALSGSATVGGAPILLSNTHLPWPNLPGWEHVTWAEAQLSGPDLEVYGVGFVGIPGITYGFDETKAWTITSAPHGDIVDAYELTLADGGYLLDGEQQAFESVEHTLMVRQPDGSLLGTPVVVERSVHGPVVARDGERALALRLALPDSFAGTTQWELARAADVDQALAALERPTLPHLNVFYADAQGTIALAMAGAFPEQPEGIDFSGIVPGDTSDTLWTTTYDGSELPRVIDPGSGWLQSANDLPWTSTMPSELAPEDYPMFPATAAAALRPAASLSLLTEGLPWTAPDVIEAKFSTHSQLADRVLDDLLAAAWASGDPVAIDAANVLDAWDRSFDASSVGAPLFLFWTAASWPGAMSGEPLPASFYADPFDSSAPLSSGTGLADPAAAVAALIGAAQGLQGAVGTLELPWGVFMTFSLGDSSLPGFGAPGDLMGTFTANAGMQGPTGALETIAGDTFVAVVDFSAPELAWAVTSYGSSTRPSSPHVDDQLELYATKQLREVWWTRDAVEANLEGSVDLTMGPR